jgi:hypothetical protein
MVYELYGTLMICYFKLFLYCLQVQLFDLCVVFLADLFIVFFFQEDRPSGPRPGAGGPPGAAPTTAPPPNAPRP